MKPKRKYAIGYDWWGKPLYVGSKVNFLADYCDSPYIKPFWINEDSVIIR